MPSTRRPERKSLPGTLEKLVRIVVPQAIQDDVQKGNAVEMIDALMALRKLTAGQARYLETLVQLVETCEARHQAIGTNTIPGIDILRHLLGENEMNDSDLARLLEVHPGMGSKILQQVPTPSFREWRRSGGTTPPAPA